MIYRSAHISFMNKPREKLIEQRRLGFVRIAFQIRGGGGRGRKKSAFIRREKEVIRTREATILSDRMIN